MGWAGGGGNWHRPSKVVCGGATAISPSYNLAPIIVSMQISGTHRPPYTLAGIGLRLVNMAVKMWSAAAMRRESDCSGGKCRRVTQAAARLQRSIKTFPQLCDGLKFPFAGINLHLETSRVAPQRFTCRPVSNSTRRALTLAGC